DPAAGVQFRAVVAIAGLPAARGLSRRDATLATPARDTHGGERIRGRGDAARGGAPVVGPHGGLGELPRPVASEGFADFSAALYLQVTQKSPDRFLKFWEHAREHLLEK